MSDSRSDRRGPSILPPKPPKKHSTVYLPQEMWDELQRIADASGEYSRNEVIQVFLENGIKAWLSEQDMDRSDWKSTKK